MQQAPKLELKTPAVVEPVVAADLATWLGVPATDPLLTPLLASSRDSCERYLGMGFITQVWKQMYDLYPLSAEWWDGVRDGPVTQVTKVPQMFSLARWPLVSVASVSFFDEEDVATVADVTSYYTSKTSRPPTVSLRQGFTWPTPSYRVADAVVIEYTVGFGAAATSVPDAIKNGIKTLAAFQYEHRGECDAEEALLRSGAVEFLKPYKVRHL